MHFWHVSFASYQLLPDSTLTSRTLWSSQACQARVVVCLHAWDLQLHKSLILHDSSNRSQQSREPCRCRRTSCQTQAPHFSADDVEDAAKANRQNYLNTALCVWLHKIKIETFLLIHYFNRIFAQIKGSTLSNANLHLISRHWSRSCRTCPFVRMKKRPL